MKKKMAIYIDKIHKDSRGISVYTKEILDWVLENSDHYSIEITLLSRSNLDLDYARKTFISKFKIFKLYTFPLKHPCIRVIEEQLIHPIQQIYLGFDVIWNTHNRGQFINNKKFFTTLHDVQPLAEPTLNANYLDTFWKKVLNRIRLRSVKKVRGVITHSNFSKNEIIKYLNINKNSIYVVHLSVNKCLFNNNKNTQLFNKIKEIYKLPSNYILNTGSYSMHKNREALVEAYEKSGLDKKGVFLVFVGPNDASGYKKGYESLKHKVGKLGISNSVLLLPAVKEKHLAEMYKHAKLFVNLSKYEGFGLTPLEALSSNVPVILSSIPVYKEIYRDKVLYAINTQEVVKLLRQFERNEKVFDKIRTQGFEFSKNFSWSIAAEKTLKILLNDYD